MDNIQTWGGTLCGLYFHVWGSFLFPSRVLDPLILIPTISSLPDDGGPPLPGPPP